MSEFFQNDGIPDQSDGVSDQVLEMTMFVSSDLQDNLSEHFGSEHIVNGYDHKLRHHSEENLSRGRVSISVFLSAMSLLIVFFWTYMFYHGTSSKTSLPHDNEVLSHQFPGLQRTFQGNNPEIIAAITLLTKEGDVPVKYLDRSKLPEQEIVNALKKDFRSIDWDKYLDRLRVNIAREPWHIEYPDLKENVEFFLRYQKIKLM